MESFFGGDRANAIVDGVFERITEGVEWVVLSEFHTVHYGPWAGEDGAFQAKKFAQSLNRDAQAIKVPAFYYCPKFGRMFDFEARKALEKFQACKAQKEIA